MDPSDLLRLHGLIATKIEARAQRQRSRFEGYRTDPVGFIEKELLGFVWSKQREICESVVKNRYTAVPACHGPGKTGIAARISAWWLSAFPPGEALLVSTAPTGHQVRALLWREINKVHRAGRLPGRTNQTEWIMPPNEIVGFGVAVRDTDPTRFQGVHAPRVLVVIDEGCGVTRAILEAAETLITNDDSRLLIIGNPDDPSTGFADNCKPGSHYNVISISAFDTPAYTGEKIPEYLRKVLVSKTWVEERKRKWGENSPMYVSKVLGRFPDVSSDGLIPLGKLQEAVNRELPAGVATWPNELGIDCARFGNDKTTFYHRLGIRARRVTEHRRRDLMEIVGKAVVLANMLGVEAIKVDDVGLGGGVTDRLNELRFLGKIKCKIVPVVVSRTPVTNDDAERFHNLRCQLAWSMRERFINDQICLLPAVDLIGDPNPEDPTPIEDGLNDLLAQAGAIKYKLMSTGHIHVETKEEMKKPPRSLPSPDDFDGLVLAFAPSDIGGEMVLPFQSVEVREPATRVPQFWPQVVCIHIERQTFAAAWGAYHESSDTIHVTDEYVAPLGEIPVHVEAIVRRCAFQMPAVMALKTDDRTKKIGIDIANRMQRLGLPMLAVDEAPLENGLAEMRARMANQRLKVYDTCTGWFAELSRFRKNAEGELLDGHIPLMHATALLVQSGMQAGASEAQMQSDEDASERDARSFGESRSETGY